MSAPGFHDPEPQVPQPAVDDLLTLDQMIDAARADADLATMFLDGPELAQISGSLVVVKGPEASALVRESLIGLGLMTPGKGISNEGPSPEVQAMEEAVFPRALALEADGRRWPLTPPPAQAGMWTAVKRLLTERFGHLDRHVAIGVERGTYEPKTALALLQQMREQIAGPDATLNEALIPHLTESTCSFLARKKGEA